jgi:ABC-type glycerol-3-phosphate transport system substrate-binding protein
MYKIIFGSRKSKRRLENIVKNRKVPRLIVIFSTIFLLVITGTFSLVGCSSLGIREVDLPHTGDPELSYDETFTDILYMGETFADISHIVDPDRNLFSGETLIVATQSASTVRPFLNQWRSRTSGVDFEIICFSDDLGAGNYRKVREEIEDLLMAGAGPVLIDGWLVDHLDPRLSHFFVDWFPIMNADPNFNEGDWFMNVFYASALDGSLYAFPNLFAYYTVAGNNTVPGISEALAAKDGVTISELLELHHEAPMDNLLWVDPNFDVSWIINFDVDRFIDFEAGWVNFNSQEFIDAITYAYQTTSPDNWMFRGWAGRDISSASGVVYQKEKYLFQVMTIGEFLKLLSLDPEFPFSNPTPLVNERGELLVQPWQSFTLSAGATPTEHALAWDFIKFMNNPDNLWRNPHLPMNSTNREKFYLVADQDLQVRGSAEHVLATGWQIGDIDIAIESTINQIAEIAHMPMALTGEIGIPNVILNLIWETLELFHDGLVSAEETAENLQNQVTQALREMGYSIVY